MVLCATVFLRITLNIGLETSFTWLYVLLLVMSFYILNKYAWTINQVEEFISENEETLNKMIWVFWAAILIPTTVYMLIFKR